MTVTLSNAGILCSILMKEHNLYYLCLYRGFKTQAIVHKELQTQTVIHFFTWNCTSNFWHTIHTPVFHVTSQLSCLVVMCRISHCSVLVFWQLRPGLWVRWLSASISSTLRVPWVPSCFYIFNTKPFYTLKPHYTHGLSEKWQGEL